MSSTPSDSVRRVFDVAFAVAVLVMASPLLLGIAIVVGVTSRGGVIYRSRRIGRGGEPFAMFKFRTMVADPDQIGRLVTCRDDKRVTRVGRWLRMTKLDELPEFWNVIRGEMSLVGPRPENPRAVSSYSPSQRALLSVLPGITSLATIRYRHEESLLDDSPDLEKQYFALMQDKLALELDYLRRRSFLCDLKILVTTLRALFH